MSLTVEQALRAYATMMNTLDASCLEPLLADDFHYASQWVFAEIESKKAYLEYIVPKMDAIRKSGSVVWAEMGSLEREFPGPCVVMAQDEKDNLVAVILATVEGGKIKRLDLCGAPSPHSASRTGDYPGLKKTKSSSEPQHMFWLEARAKKLEKELNASYDLKQKASRASAKVVLLHREAFSMVDDWIDHIELRRSAGANFAVWGNKYGENPMNGRRQWGEWERVKGLKSPMAIFKAIEDMAEFLSVDVEWVDAIPIIATIDWLTAAVIANRKGFDIPALPDVDDLLNQRSLRPFGRMTIGAIWGYEMHEFDLTLDQWIRVLKGEQWSAEKRYSYEGQRFTGDWSFDGLGSLSVGYDGGGQGWEGNLSGLDMIVGPVVDEVDLAKLALSAINPEKV
jgi:hypothetical protein